MQQYLNVLFPWKLVLKDFFPGFLVLKWHVDQDYYLLLGWGSYCSLVFKDAICT